MFEIPLLEQKRHDAGGAAQRRRTWPSYICCSRGETSHREGPGEEKYRAFGSDGMFFQRVSIDWNENQNQDDYQCEPIEGIKRDRNGEIPETVNDLRVNKLWLVCIGDKSVMDNLPAFQDQSCWNLTVEAEGERERDGKDEYPPTRLNVKCNEKKLASSSIIWRGLPDTSGEGTQTLDLDMTRDYLNCADIPIFLLQTSSTDQWRDVAYRWLKEALQSDCGHLRGVIFFQPVEGNGFDQRALEEFFRIEVARAFYETGSRCDVVFCKGREDSETVKNAVDRGVVQICTNTTQRSIKEQRFNPIEPVITSEVSFSCSLFWEAFFNLLLGGILAMVVKCIRGKCCRCAADGSTRAGRVRRFRRPYLRCCDRVRMVRTFWGASKSLFARYPWHAAASVPSPRRPIGFEDKYRAECNCKRFKMYALFLLHWILFVGFGFSISYGFVHTRVKAHEHAIKPDRIVAHQFFYLYIALALLFASWVATTSEKVKLVNLRQQRELSLVDKGCDFQQVIETEELGEQCNLRKYTMEGLVQDLRHRYNTDLNEKWYPVSFWWAFSAFVFQASVTYTTTQSHVFQEAHQKVEDVAWYYCAHAAVATIFATAIYAMMNTAGKTIHLAENFMWSLTTMLERDSPSANEGCCVRCSSRPSCAPLCSCCRSSQPPVTNRRIPAFQTTQYLPLVSREDVYTWLSMRQELFRHANLGFDESSGILLVPILAVVMAAGYVFVSWLNDSDLLMRSTVFADIVFTIVALLFVAYKASNLEHLQQRQASILHGHSTMLREFIDELEETPPSRKKLLHDAADATDVVLGFVRANSLTLVVWPGISLTRQLVASVLVALSSLASVVSSIVVDVVEDYVHLRKE
eukprot:gb/GECG01008583.1/.p1 GENE.gb/GECG01008583.1/~~gb/GECG01008583.1/.p1  ORF type:complete len:859 (+),score=60.24 gb/GECG01008583.1/:1-2577(+)